MPPRAKATPPPRSPPPMSSARLRLVFNKFDTDGSGAVSIDEMQQMIKSLNIDLPPDQLKKLMAEADPDNSGQIEYEEFVTVLKKQLKDGKGGLAGVVTEASASFGWLNPLSWFGDEPAPAAAPSQSAPPTPTSPAKKVKKSPKGTRKSTPGSKSPSKSTALVVRSPISPTHRMKKTQGEVQAVNREQAADMRNEANAAKNWFLEQQEQFLAVQHEKVLRGHQQAVERVEAIEALKQVKRQMGSEMRKELEKKMQEEVQKKREFVAACHNTVFDARKKKQSAVRARFQAERENAIAIGEAAKKSRAENKEKAKATVRREEQAAKDFTARVRYETRPEVRQVGASMFQAQRDGIAEAARQKAEADAAAMKAAQQAYLAAADQVKERVERLHASTKASRQSLKEARRQGAADLRANLEAERQRKKEIERQTQQTKQLVHDEIHTWSKTSVLDSD